MIYDENQIEKRRTRKQQEILRYRVSVPAADSEVIAWLNSQSDQSMAVRMLIHQQVKQTGLDDVTCMSLVRGPTETEKPLSNNVTPVAITSVISQTEKTSATVVTKEQDREQMATANDVPDTGTNDVTDDDGFIDPDKLLGL